jgi:hypothetical protein
MNNFNQLLPPEILDRLDNKNVDIDLTLDSEDCESRWPGCRVTIDGHEIFNGIVVKQQSIVTSRNVNDSFSNIRIEYYGKEAKDTSVDNQGQIIANQNLGISKFKLNGVDIIKNGMIYQAKFIMNLDPNKEKYFKEHNIPNRNHDYHFYENGVWSLQIEIPVLKYIINITKQVETFEKIPYDNIIKDIIKKLEL